MTRFLVAAFLLSACLSSVIQGAFLDVKDIPIHEGSYVALLRSPTVLSSKDLGDYWAQHALATPSLAEALRAPLDFRGQYGPIHVFIVSTLQAGEAKGLSNRALETYLREDTPAVLVGGISGSSLLQTKQWVFILERVQHANDNVHTVGEWAHSVRQVNSQDFPVNILLDCGEEGRFVLMAPHDSQEKLLSLLPERSFILPMPESTVTPAVELSSSHAFFQLPNFESVVSVKEDKIDELLNKIDTETLKSDVQYLTGERDDSAIKTRHAKSDDARKVADWIQEQLEGTGCEVSQMQFRSDFGPNVVCVYKGTDPNVDEIVIIGAHYDDRAQRIFDVNARAPGADDDGSGSGMLLSVAKALARGQVQLPLTVHLVAFCGEEQGLIGSKAYAELMKKQNVKVRAMIQGDMLAYHKPGEPMQLGFPDRYHTPELSKNLGRIVARYVPELKVGTTNGCCSDHQSFFEKGFPATAFFERNGPIADPMYHNTGDLSLRTGYDFEQLRLMSRAMLACLLLLAGLNPNE